MGSGFSSFLWDFQAGSPELQATLVERLLQGPINPNLWFRVLGALIGRTGFGIHFAEDIGMPPNALRLFVL